METNSFTVTSVYANSGIELIDKSHQFEEGAAGLKKTLKDAEQAVRDDPSSAYALAEYQSALSAYTLFRNAQSSTIKAHRDVVATTLSNLR